MKTTPLIVTSAALLFCMLALGSHGFADGTSGRKESVKESAAVPVVHANDTDTMRLQGEQRFRANCSRCHAAPQKFPPRVMGTILRHMRVRATLTDEDARMILFYMTQ